MPWQNYVVDVAGEVDIETGIPFYHTVIIVVMRQQGKTELLLPVMAHRAMGWDRFGPQTILYTTQTGAKAREKWEDIHIKRLEQSPFASMFTTRLRINHEAMIWINGSMWKPVAGTKKAGGTGDSIDFGAIDEAWSADSSRELSMRPAMLTRPSRQLWITSMVPGLARAKTTDSQYLRDKMMVGREMVRNDVRQGIAYFEFGALPEEDPTDPQTWLRRMPALCPRDPREPVCRCDPAGVWRHTITVQSVQGDFDSMSIIDFSAEYLSIWPKDNRPTWTFINEQTWTDLRDQHSEPASSVVLGVDMDEDRNRCFIAAAGKRIDRDWHQEIVEPGQNIPADTAGLDWVEDRVVEICSKWDDILAVVIDPRGPAQSLILPLTNKGIEVMTPNTLEISAACARWTDAVEGKGESPIRARHRDQRVLTNAVAYARKIISPKNRTFAWDRIGGEISISPLYAMTLAMLGYEAKVDEDYDVLDSVYGPEGACPACGKYPEQEGMPIVHYDDCRIEYPREDTE
jgi:hypothetical protein